jgi:hypothetical protein
MEWGSRLEDAVAQKWQDDHDGYLAEKTGTWRHADREWQRATPDRIVTWEGFPGRLLEVKTSPFGDEWGPDGSDQVPLHYRCQVIWQQDTLGLYDRTDVAVLIGGWDYRVLHVEYDETDAKVMRDAAERFLDDVRQGNRPPIDGADATYQTIRVQPDGLEDRDVEIPFGTVARWDAAYEAAQITDAELAKVRAEVLDLIGTGKRAVCEGRRIAYRTVRDDGTTLALQPYRSTSA